MMLWAVLTILVSAAALFVAAPLLSGPGMAQDSPANGVTAFRDQIAEIDRELADGTLDAATAQSAKAEIRRRVLARGEDLAPTRVLALVERKFLAGAMAGIVAIGGTLLYAVGGSPAIPSAPRSAAPSLSAAGSSQANPAGAVNAASAAPVPASGLASVDDMIDRLAQRLSKAPDDPDGWRMLGWSYFRTDRYPEAANAYGRASALQPSVAALKTAWAEALIRANEGKVTKEALRLVSDALKADAKDARARYFAGLAKEQAGDAKGAVEVWLALLAESSDADDWYSEVKQQAIEVAAANGIDISARLPRSSDGPGILGKLSKMPTAATAPQAIPGPSEADVKAAAALSPGERDAMIRSMVDGLQAKLDANPNDIEGWVRVIRSRSVLGETAKVKAAIDRAQQIFSKSPADLERVASLARELGMAP